MKTRAMDKASKTSAVNHCLYPFATTHTGCGYPSTREFEVVRDQHGEAIGIKSRVAFDSRTLISRLFGYALSEPRQNTFKISSRLYLYDEWFLALLQHACHPNTHPDFDFLELWSIVPIPAGTGLTIDYTQTAEVLHQQFACTCGAPDCRGWIKGSQEQINAEGLLFLERWARGERP